MDNSTERCAVCGRLLARVGRAKRYVHANQFHMRFNHEPVAHRPATGLRAGSRAQARVIDLRERVSA